MISGQWLVDREGLLEGDWGGPFYRFRPVFLDREQALEKGAIALQGDAEILGGNVVAAIPLLLEFGTFLGENFGEALHGAGDQAVGLFDGFARFIDERSLNFAPAISQTLEFIVGEQRRWC